MIGIFARLFTFVIVGCGLMLTGVYALAGMSSTAVRDFYAPEGCASPCFLGITIGETPIDEARAILTDHDWIDDVRTSPAGDTLIWLWNGTQPAFVTRYEDDQFVGRMLFEDGIASSVYLVTGTRLGDLVGAFGMPDSRSQITRVSSTRVLLVQTAAYFERDMEVETTMRCPVLRQNRMWYSFATIRLPAQNAAVYSVPNGDLGC